MVPGLGDTLQSCGDVDAVAHQVAVALLDDIAQMDADAELDAALGRKPALRSTMPFCTSMAQRTASTTLRNSMRTAVPGALHDATVVDTDGRGDQIAPERPQPCQRTFLVAAREAAEADHVSGQDSGELALFRHGGVTLRPSETGESLR